jgi:glycosyltransferase involved in cell wall biosynthesis
VNQPLRILLVSSVRPGEPAAGSVLLQRHLCESEETTVSILPECKGGLVWRIAHRLGLKGVALACMVLSQGRRWDRSAVEACRRAAPDAILTVAHGDAHKSALRIAARMRLPLIAFYHDWWPDIPPLPHVLRMREAREFQMAYRQSAVALCVSEQMRRKLGEHPHAEVLFPIPGFTSTISSEEAIFTNGASRTFRIRYGGNLVEYGPMLGQALLCLADLPRVRLEVRGNGPLWPVSLQEQMKRSGNWLDFVAGFEWQFWLQSSNAFLVPMVFDPGMRRRMETSFPSKLPEFTQCGKPIVIWGPEYCSAVQWARPGHRALCVTDPNPTVLRCALERLAASPAEQERLAVSAREAARGDFNPERLQAQFIAALRRAVCSQNVQTPNHSDIIQGSAQQQQS